MAAALKRMNGVFKKMKMRRMAYVKKNIHLILKSRMSVQLMEIIYR